MEKSIRLISCILFMLIIPSILALDSMGDDYDINQNITITQVCEDATYINITSIQYPNGTRLSINQEMTKDGGDFIYYFSNTDQLGRYDIRGVSDGCTNTFATYFKVGQQMEISDSMFFIFLLIILIGIFLLSFKLILYKDEIDYRELYALKKSSPFAYYFNMTIKRNVHVFGYFGAYLSILLFLVILNMGLFYLNFSDLANISKNFVLIVSWGLIPFTLVWIIWLVVHTITSVIEIKKYQYGGMKR